MPRNISTPPNGHRDGHPRHKRQPMRDGKHPRPRSPWHAGPHKHPRHREHREHAQHPRHPSPVQCDHARRHYRPPGTTLLELLAALAVVAILAAAAWPALRQAMDNQAVVHAADRLAASLALARTTAANHRAEVMLTPRAGSDRLDDGWQLAVAPADAGQNTPGEAPFAVVALDQPCLRITLRATGGGTGAPALRLTAVGYSRSELGGFFAATFQVRCHAAQRQVRLGAQGRIRVCKPGADADCD